MDWNIPVVREGKFTSALLPGMLLLTLVIYSKFKPLETSLANCPSPQSSRKKRTLHCREDALVNQRG